MPAWARGRKAGWGVEACGGAAVILRPAAAGCEVVVVGATDSAGDAVAHVFAADVAGADGSVVDGAQQDFGCPPARLP